MRLRDLTPAEMDQTQHELCDRIASGPRAAGPQHFALTDANGALTGPFGVMVHDPAVGAPLQELGSAIRYATGLSDRVREIAILAVAAATGSTFEQYAHERLGLAAGLDEAELAALADETFTSSDPVEHASYAFCRRLLDGRARLGDDDYETLSATLGTTTITELTILVGYYRTLAQLLDVYDVGVPEQQSDQ